ncbi:MAG: phage integrase SAM-like domain-containing protein [Bacteroidetes bacterium]|nr:phage integrase SAM-like domain-containing protein [Bacteroidota bacterium]
MATVNFYLDRPYRQGVNKWDIAKAINSKKNINNLLNPRETMIRLFVTFPGRKILKYSTGEKIYATQWDFSKRAVRSAVHGSLSLNTRMSILKTAVLEAIRTAITENPDVSLAEIDKKVRHALNGKNPSFNTKTFLEYLNDYIEEKRLILKPKTITKLESFKNVFQDFVASSYNEIEPRLLSFSSVDDSLDLKMRTYLFNERRNLNNSVSKFYETLSGFMAWGLRRKLHSNISYQNFSAKRDKKDVVFLTVDELDALKKLDLPFGTADRTIRDLFLFMAFTGQRIGDANNICRKDLYLRDDQSIDWILFQRKGHKTMKMELPLLNKSKEIILPYYHKANDPQAKLFSVYSEPHMNRRLKALCGVAGITETTTIVQYRNKERVETVQPKNKFISMHTGRRSFISNSLALGLSPEIIKQFSGHVNLKTMNLYVGVQYETKRKFLFESWQGETVRDAGDPDRQS